MLQVGPFVVVETLGRGASGVVHRARDAAGREVALKVLRAAAVADPRARKRFLQEVQALGKVQHPGVVRIVGTGEAPSGPWIAMELVRGESLAARLERDGPLPLTVALRTAEQLARAVAALHASGVVHRDVNPGNVLLRAPGAEPVLTDFGLSRDLTASASVSRASLEGGFLGTPGYWPPEQARGDLRAIGPASDVYSLGATLYAMLVGRPPFVIETLDDVLRVLEERHAPASSSRSDLPAEVDALLDRCMARRPADRFASAADLADALRAARRGRAASRSPGRAFAVAGVALVLAGVEVAAFVMASGDTAAPPAPAVVLAPSPAPPTTTTAAEPPAAPPAPVPTSVETPAPPAPAPPADPAAVRALVARALAAIARDDLDGAERDLDDALSRSPDDVDALTNLSLVANRRGQVGRAFELLDRAVSLAPDAARPIGVRGLLRNEQGDFRGAIEDLDRSLELDPKNHLGWHNRACAHLALGDAAAALADQLRVQELAPAYAPGRYVAARALLALGELERAEREAGEAVARRPGYGAAWLLRAEVREQRGDVAGALADARQALATDRLGADFARAARDLIARLEAAGPR